MSLSKSNKLQRLSFYVKQTSDNKEMIFRCPLHDDRRGHLYVSTDTTEYICFKCGTRGKNFIKFLVQNNDFLNDKDKIIVFDILSDLLLETKDIDDSIKNIKKLDNQKDNQKFQKIRLFNELIDILKNHGQINKHIIYKYFSDTRNITDKNYIDDLIEQGYILFYSKELYQVVNEYVETIFNKKMIYINQAIGLTVPNGGILQFRTIDKDINNHLRYYTLKLKEVTPNIFYIGDTRNPNTCIIVEGVFDAIKLDYLFRKHMDSYLIIALLGKNNVNAIVELQNILQHVSVYVIALDMDTNTNDIKRVYNTIIKVSKNEKQMVYVLTRKGTDVINKDFDNIRDFNEFKNKFILVNYTKFVTNVWKLSTLFDVDN